MPHIIVKMYSGKSEKEKSAIAFSMSKALSQASGKGEGSISVSIEDVSPSDWIDKVYDPDIQGKPGQLYKKPGYSRNDLR